jgi:hypothetical protein
VFIGSIITLAVAGGSALVGYWQARKFTMNKLRFVDAVHKGSVPVIAGLAFALLAWPLTWVLPLVGIGTAALFGGGVAMGVAAGARDIRRRLSSG